MSLRSRPTPSTTEPSTTDPTTTTTIKPPLSPPSAVSQTLAITANLANLLLTGTLLAFQLLIPIFTSNGACDSATASLTLHLLLFASCFLASFTDSFKSSSNNQIFYGFATIKGMFLFDYPSSSLNGTPDLSKYCLRFIDWVHAIMSVLVFGAMAFRDKNVVKCLYPSPGHETEEVLDIVPIAIGLICSLLFVVFPTRRHGIGYPVSP
ncbi:Protein DMP5 [Camellia lanceoleosa]|uniref:Protein DMP5 n=1 Tax=Camellia lanceoleosa TaxID=1840588 RepID=A0ACC0IN31_9ERIC|nr:Protein DMP5 [Camellia lanceoleosa]